MGGCGCSPSPALRGGVGRGPLRVLGRPAARRGRQGLRQRRYRVRPHARVRPRRALPGLLPPDRRRGRAVRARLRRRPGPAAVGVVRERRVLRGDTCAPAGAGRDARRPRAGRGRVRQVAGAPGAHARGRGRPRPRDAWRHRLLERGRRGPLGDAGRRDRRRGADARAGADPPPRRGVAAARGRTIVASGSVRVFERGDERFACRTGRSGRILLAGAPPPRIVGDRWLLVLGRGTPACSTRARAGS